MEIILEVGTDDQKSLISSELKIMQEILNGIESPLQINKIIVTPYFDHWVNEIQGSEGYTAFREEQIAVAKTINTDDGTYFIFSPLLYQEGQDTYTRLVIYVHELFHGINYWRFPQAYMLRTAEYQKFLNLYILYDEYYCNRKAFEITDRAFPEKSRIFLKSTYLKLKCHYQSLLNPEPAGELQECINRYRWHGNLDQIISEFNQYYDPYAKDLVYLASMIDHYTKYWRLKECIADFNFVGKAGIELIDYLKTKYENYDIDLIDGLDLMGRFIATFGCDFEDTDGGLYCHVVDVV